jgi:toxin ParE1/3/4
MVYLVRITRRAENDLEYIYGQINAAESEAAQKWFRGLKREILALGRFPNRCPATPENKALRNLLYGHKPHIYRVIYRVIEARRVVDVLHIRYGARKGFLASDLD